MNKDIEKLNEIAKDVTKKEIVSKQDIETVTKIADKIIQSLDNRPKKYFKRIS